MKEDTDLIVGYIDKIDKSICGWAYSPENSNLLKIDSFIDDEFYQTVLADRYRSDVLEAGHGKGYSGFTIPLPEKIFNGEFHILNVKVQNHAGFSFQGMPVRQLFGNIEAIICPVDGSAADDFFYFWGRYCKEVSVENTMTEEKIAAFIHRVTNQSNSHLELAYVNNEIIGYCLLEGKQDKNYQHCAVLRISVLSDYQQRGVGKKLIQAALVFAQKFLVRVELTVAVTNHSAINLYLKSGFKKEGILRKSCVESNTYVDEIIMSFLSVPNQDD